MIKLNILKNVVYVIAKDTLNSFENAGKTLVNRSKMRYNAFKEYYEWQSAIEEQKRVQKENIDNLWRKAENTALDCLKRDLSAIK